VITRCSNNYGPYQFPEKLIPLIITNALDHQPVPVYGDGKQVRDWLYVEDHCRAIDAVYAAGTHGGVYNIGGNNERENIDIVRLVIHQLRELTGDEKITKDLIRHVTDRPGHDRRYAIDSSKIQKELRWRPQTPFAEGVHKTIRWYLQNRTWIERIKTGEYQK
jgi:dTDP-glucose 4,6-dehydratase